MIEANYITYLSCRHARFYSLDKKVQRCLADFIWWRPKVCGEKCGRNANQRHSDQRLLQTELPRFLFLVSPEGIVAGWMRG